MAFKANAVRALGLGGLRRGAGIKWPRRRAAPKKKVEPKKSKLSIGRGKDAGMSDLDIRLRAVRERKARLELDPRYQNPDGTNKSVQEVQQGHYRDDVMRQQTGENNKLKLFAQFASHVSNLEKKDGVITLDKKAVGMFAPFVKQFASPDHIPSNITMQMVDDKAVFTDVDTGKTFNSNTPKASVWDISAKIGNNIKQYDERALKQEGKDSGKLNDKQNAILGLHKNELKVGREEYAAGIANGLKPTDQSMLAIKFRIDSAQKGLGSILMPNGSPSLGTGNPVNKANLQGTAPVKEEEKETPRSKVEGDSEATGGGIKPIKGAQTAVNAKASLRRKGALYPNMDKTLTGFQNRVANGKMTGKALQKIYDSEKQYMTQGQKDKLMDLRTLASDVESGEFSIKQGSPGRKKGGKKPSQAKAHMQGIADRRIESLGEGLKKPDKKSKDSGGKGKDDDKNKKGEDDKKKKGKEGGDGKKGSSGKSDGGSGGGK